MNIASNISVYKTSENLINGRKSLDNSAEKLATGKKINKASDNSSGLAIADKLRTQASSLNQSVDNAVSGMMLTQIADNAINEQSTMLDTIKQKLIQARTSTTSDEGRKSIAKDIVKLMAQLDEIASMTNYNGKYLLQKDRDDISASNQLHFQVGEFSSNTIGLDDALIQANSTGYDLLDLKNLDIDSLTMDFAAEQMGKVDEALNKANLFRSDYGMIHNQLKAASRNLRSEFVNISNAESIIRDTDYAKESAKFSKGNITQKTGSFAMSQATEQPKNAMRLVL